MLALWPVVLVVVSSVGYHLSQRALGAAGNPWSALAVAYGVALVACLALALVSPDGLRVPGRPERNAGLVIGAAALGIEAGFYFIYRAGWPLASAGVIASLAVTTILAVLGVVLFREQPTAARVAGLALAAPAAFLIARG